MASPNSTFTELVTTTLRHTKREVADQITNHNALLRWLRERGHVKSAAGGTSIQLPLAYAENGTFQRFDGYDELNIGQSDVLTSAEYQWRNIALHVTANGPELRMNSSKESMINLVNARIDVAKSTAQNGLSVDTYSDGALANQIGGLAHLITADGTGTVGGIVAGTYTIWKNKFQEVAGGDTAVDGASTGTALTFANLKAAMNTHWLSLNRGADKPDLLLASHDMYSLYESGLQDLQRYASADTGKLGFESLKYKTSSIIFDDNTNFGTTAELIYFLNTKYLFLMEHSDAKWEQGEAMRPINQDAEVIPMIWMGQMCTNGRRFQGRLHDLAT